MKKELQSDVILFFIIIPFIQLLFCSCGTSVNAEEYKLNYKGKNILMKAKSMSKTPASNLFDNLDNTQWILSQSDYESPVRFIFSEPVYIKSVNIDCDVLRINGDEKLRFEIYKDEISPPQDSVLYQIDKKKNKQSVFFKNSRYADIMRVKVLTIDLVQSNGQSIDIGKKLPLYALDFEFSKLPYFQSTLSLSEIKKKYIKKTKNGWELPFVYPFKPEEEVIELQVQKNLIYHALMGNKEAEEIFKSYYPSQADLSECHSGLLDWYMMTNKLNK